MRPGVERRCNKGRTLSGLVRAGFEVCSGSAVDFAAMLDAGDFDGRVAPVPVIFSYQDEGATGPSLLGTGDDSTMRGMRL